MSFVLLWQTYRNFKTPLIDLSFFRRNKVNLKSYETPQIDYWPQLAQTTYCTKKMSLTPSASQSLLDVRDRMLEKWRNCYCWQNLQFRPFDLNRGLSRTWWDQIRKSLFSEGLRGKCATRFCIGIRTCYTFPRAGLGIKLIDQG